MSILLWLVGFLGYVGFLIYLMQRPPDVYLGLGLLALLAGFISFVVQKKWLLILSFIFIFGGVLLTYKMLFQTRPWLWVGALGVTLFLGVLCLRED
jgi:hypothetical protein